MIFQYKDLIIDNGGFKYFILDLFLMNSPRELNTLNNIVDQALSGLENWCSQFNSFCLIFFKYMKYIFVFILFFIGVLILFRLRGAYFKNKASDFDRREDPLKKIRIVLASLYFFFALGILFNYLIYFLIWILDPLPDRFIFNFINFNGDINPYYLNRIEDISLARWEHEKTIYYCVALGSFLALIHFVLSIWYFLANNQPIINPRVTIANLICSLTELLLLGFTTCLPFFL